MTDGYTFQLTCPVCAGPVDHVTHSAPTPNATRAVIHCNTCDRDGVITVNVSMAYKSGHDYSPRRRTKAEEAERKRRERARANA